MTATEYRVPRGDATDRPRRADRRTTHSDVQFADLPPAEKPARKPTGEPAGKPAQTERPGRGTGPADRPARPGELRRILGLFTNYRGRMLFVATLIVASALISLASPFLLRHILDVSLPERNTALTALLAGGMVAVAISTTVLDVIQSRQSTIIGQAVMHDLRSRVFSHLQRMSLGFFTRTRTGEVQSRIAGDIGSMQSVVTNTATTVVSNGTTVIASLLAMLLLDWKLTLVSLVLVPLFVWISRRVGSMRRTIATARQEKMADMSALVAESLSVSGILLTKTMGRTAELSRRFDTASADLSDLETRAAMTGRWRQSSIGIIISILPATIYLAAAFTVSGTTGDVSIGTLVAFTTLQGQLLRPMMGLLRTGVELQTSMAMFRRIFDYLDLPVEIVETADPVRPAVKQGHLRIENVCFAYPDAESPTLAGVSLDLTPGSHTAVVGSTGSGKTTLGYLAARLYEPGSGRITLDGVDLADWSMSELADQIGIVSQETYLLHASIADNLRFAAPDANDEDLRRAAAGAQILDLIDSLPAGFDTVVGERGYRFSGGEKQRLAIARILLRNPRVLILDEATSALDTRTEAAVARALETAAEGRTTLTIAHRLSTVRTADRIVVLDKGRIVEQGSHAELATTGGAYAALLAGAEQ